MHDLISRQAAIALAKDICVPIKDGTVYKHRCIDPDAIRDLPSVQQEPCVDAEFWRKRAEYYSKMCHDLIADMSHGVKIDSVEINEDGIKFTKKQQEPCGDTISRQAAIDTMCSACWDWCDEGVCKRVSALQNIPSAQPEQKRKWMPASERLPDLHPFQVGDPDGQFDIAEDYSMISDYVLVQTADGQMAVAEYEDDLDGRIYWQTDTCQSLEVIAWMPLPEPYMREPE